jgi:hypothetical protein
VSCAPRAEFCIRETSSSSPSGAVIVCGPLPCVLSWNGLIEIPASTERPSPSRQVPSRRPSGSSPKAPAKFAAAAMPLKPLADFSTTLATTVLPCMSIPGAAPRTMSILATCAAGMRCRTLIRSSVLLVGRSPSINTLPAAPAKPRTALPSSKAKPGKRETMS